MEKRQCERFLAYLPAIVVAVLSAVVEILYATVIPDRKLTGFLGVAFVALVPFAVIFLNRRFRLGFPLYLIILICLHLFLSVDFGTALDFYGRFSWWDLFVHGYFGTVGCAISYYLYLRIEGRPPRAYHFLVFVLMTIAFAAIWEIYEFVADMILGSDMLGVWGALAEGISPLTDTVTDMAIAIAGAALFCAVVLLKRWIAKRKMGDAPQDGDAE